MLEFEKTQALLKEREDDCEALALKVQELVNEQHRSQDMIQLLRDKDLLLHDALHKNQAMVSELEQTTTERTELRQQVRWKTSISASALTSAWHLSI